MDYVFNQFISSKIVAGIALVFFVVAFLFGLSACAQTHDMQHMMHGDQGMSVGDHIDMFQSSFVSVLTGGFSLLFVLFAVALFGFFDNSLYAQAGYAAYFLKRFLYKLFDPLLAAFSQGIIAPKIY